MSTLPEQQSAATPYAFTPVTKQHFPPWQASDAGVAPLPQQSRLTAQVNPTGAQQLSMRPPQTPVQHSAFPVHADWEARQQRAGSPAAAPCST